MCSKSNLAAAIVIYNNKIDELERLFEGLLLEGLLQNQIYILENSPSASLESTLKHRYPSVNYAKSESNTCYAGGNNRLLAQIFKEDYTCALVLNPDIEVMPGSLNEIIRLLTSTRNVGAIGGLELKPSGEVRTSGGKCYNLWLSRGTWHSIRCKAPINVPFLQGAFVCITLDAYREGIRFSELLKMYYDEVDLGLQITRKNLSLICTPEVRYKHYNEEKETLRTGFWHHRNRVLLAFNHGDILRFTVFSAYFCGIELPIKTIIRLARVSLFDLHYAVECLRGAANGYQALLKLKKEV